MERHLILIEKILGHVEDAGDGIEPVALPEVLDYTDQEVLFHSQMCMDLGYFTYDFQTQSIYTLTPDGRDTLETIREQVMAVR